MMPARARKAVQWGQHPDLEGFLRRRAERVGEVCGIGLAEGFKRLTAS